MALMLFFLVPVAILLAWAVAHDLKRRRAPGVDVASRVRAVRASAEAMAPPESGGGGP